MTPSMGGGTTLPPMADVANLITRLIQAYAAKPSSEILREMAAQVVRLRMGYDDPAGRSWEYRQVMSAVYEASGVDEDALAAVKNGLRYHVGNLLRETLTPEELQAAGLRIVSPRERIEAARANLISRAREVGLGPPDSLLAAIRRAREAVALATVQAHGSSLAERKAAVDAVRELAADVRELREALKP